jgi:hypothetical protein
MTTFYFNNGATADSPDTLCQALEQIDDGTFSHHCNKERNDFVAWLSDESPDVAKKISRIKTRKGLIKKLKTLK